VRRTALRIALSRRLACSPESLVFVRNEWGKPALADGQLHFSVSSSDDCCLVAVTEVGDIGIDVERLEAVAQLAGIARRVFEPEEAAAILRLHGDSRLRAFYECWTRKEAYLKATGTGFAGAGENGHDPGPWTLATVRPGPGFIGSVAVRGAHVTGAALEPSPLPLPGQSDV
jgi:4'-phosphopantetheinyl transferase